VFGPFSTDSLKPYYMRQALGIAPVQGRQITESALCGSCHTIRLPVLPANVPAPPDSSSPHTFEQTTYLEWLNSEYAGPGARSCQDCHMPDHFADRDSLTFAIANVEDGDFPLVGNRAPADSITPHAKRGYRRHTLVGLSIFANRIFQQFPEILGLTTLDPGTPLTFGPASRGAVHRLWLTGREMENLADNTVDLAISAEATPSEWRATVRVKNLAGHKFPSGVGFRRAFLEVLALDSLGRVVWGSGRTDGAGVIVDAHGRPLPSEFTADWRDLQPDYPTIARENQVQVFETRHVNEEGRLTTSFLGLAREVKDNRLLPTGWRLDGPWAEVTRPVELGGKPETPTQPGTRTIVYRIPRSAGAVASIRVRLLYQSTPPYYLADRFAVSGRESDRLLYLVSYLDLRGSRADYWSLEVARAESPVP
jgi:hypothetical protein